MTNAERMLMQAGYIVEEPKLHPSTFAYLKPSEEQLALMERLRMASRVYADTLQALLPLGPDKTYTLRKLREVAMWANVAVTREADGSPRELPHDPALKEYPADHPVEGDLGSVPL